jgi:hypothetical protein
MREFGLAIIATRNCLLHGISNSNIEADDSYTNRKVSYTPDESHVQTNVVKQSVIACCEISITELKI